MAQQRLAPGALPARQEDAAAEALREVLELDSAVAWPGFRLRSEVLIFTDPANGIVAVAGDTARDPEYLPWRRDPRIRIRRGTPPDSLLGLRIGIGWRGTPGIATALEYRPGHDAVGALVHEAFHTYQHRSSAAQENRFRGGTPLRRYTDTDSAGLALAALESRALADAIAEPERRRAIRLARAALEIREARCRQRGAPPCRGESEMEQLEGTPSYVSARITRDPRYRTDVLRARLEKAPSRAHMERGYFYDSGFAWLILLERFGPPGWKTRAEVEMPDRILASTILRRPVSPERGARALERSPQYGAALAGAASTLRFERDSAASAERAFWQQPGVPLRVRWRARGGRVSISSYTTVSSAGDPSIGYRYGKGANVFEFTGPHREAGGATVLIVQPSALVARVNGAAVPTGGAARVDSGAVSITAPRLSIGFEHATLRQFADSITVTAVVQ